MLLYKWHTFWTAPCLIYFIVILFYIARKWLLMKKLATVLPSKLESYYVSGTKGFFRIYIQKYTDICIQSASRIQVLGVKKWCSANIFYDTKQKYVCWKICKVRSEKGFWLCCMSILFSVSSELRLVKWVRFSEPNCIVKWVIFSLVFVGFAIHVWNNIFQKKNYNYVLYHEL